MTDPRIDEWLAISGALRHGHFRLSSGLHSPAYVQCALLLEHPERAARLGRMLADRLRDRQPDSVLSPALGGLIIGYEVARSLERPFRFVERQEGTMCLRRGFHLTPGERLVIVEDVVTTGRSTNEAVAVAAAAGAEVCAIASILDRSGDSEPFSVPFVSLKQLALPVWSAADCPLCARGEPIDRPGSRPDS